MSRIEGNIEQIVSDKELSHILVQTPIGSLSSVVVDDPEENDHLTLGKRVKVLFKETEVMIAIPSKDWKVSARNHIPARIHDIEKGKVLSRVIAETGRTRINALITTSAVEEMALFPGLDVILLIKSSEVSLETIPDHV